VQESSPSKKEAETKQRKFEFFVRSVEFSATFRVSVRNQFSVAVFFMGEAPETQKEKRK
jgi:hypothetical protein